MRDRKGFSLLEVLIVLGIIGILSAVAIPLYYKSAQKARLTTKLLPNLRIIEQNIAVFYSSGNVLPTSDDLPLVLEGADTRLYVCDMVDEELVLTIDSPNFTDDLSFFHGYQIRARPEINEGMIRSFRLTGNLAVEIGF